MMSLGLGYKRRHTAGLLAAGVAVASLVGVSPVSASAPTELTLRHTWGTNGRVSAILAAPASGRVYVAGSFTAVTDASGTTSKRVSNLAVFLPETGRFDTSWHANTNGPVSALALSGGRLYIGGDFTKVKGKARRHLASVNVTSGALSPWKPAVVGSVAALAVSNSSVYVGGNFTSLAGESRKYVGRVGIRKGVLHKAWSPQPNARVRTLVLSGNKKRVYIGGDFEKVNGKGIGRRIASLSTARGGMIKGFNAGATNAGREAPAYSLHLDGSRLLAGVGGKGGGCTSLNASTGATQWSKHATGNIQAITAFRGAVYCGGHFNGPGSFAGQERFKLAAVDEATGSTRALSLRINSALGVWALDHGPSRLFLGGDFTRVNLTPQPHLAVLD